jgi:adenylate cyclase
MGREIERKFLVCGDAWRRGAKGLYCRQGYLASGIGCTVRVRVLGDKGFLTVKGRMEGISRAEYEYGISVQDAHEMLDRLCSRPLIEKYRYHREHADQMWEVDEFVRENRGLVVAEIELQVPDQPVVLPDWVGREVTDDPRYLNVNLAKRPYTTWSHEES